MQWSEQNYKFFYVFQYFILDTESYNVKINALTNILKFTQLQKDPTKSIKITATFKNKTELTDRESGNLTPYSKAPLRPSTIYFKKPKKQ